MHKMVLFHLKATEVQLLNKTIIIILVSFAEMKSKQIQCDVVEIEVISRRMCHLLSLLKAVMDRINNFCYRICSIFYWRHRCLFC